MIRDLQFMNKSLQFTSKDPQSTTIQPRSMEEVIPSDPHQEAISKPPPPPKSMIKTSKMSTSPSTLTLSLLNTNPEDTAPDSSKPQPKMTPLPPCAARVPNPWTGRRASEVSTSLILAPSADLMNTDNPSTWTALA